MNMIRLGIFGTDSSHSFGISQYFNVPGNPQHIPGAKVVGIFGLEEARNKQVAEKGAIPFIAKTPQELIGMIDAAIIVFRHGSRHWEYAKMCIDAGLPTFVDKPFASSTEDAKKIVAYAKKKGVPISSYSSSRFGKASTKFQKDVAALAKKGPIRAAVLYGPGSSHDPFDGIFFYAVHQVEFMLAAFGNEVKSARGVDENGMLVASIKYKDGRIVTIHEINGGWPAFNATAFGAEGMVRYEMQKDDDGFLVGAKKFMKMFKTGQMPLPYDELTISTRVLVAINESLKAGGKEVAIK